MEVKRGSKKEKKEAKTERGRKEITRRERNAYKIKGEEKIVKQYDDCGKKTEERAKERRGSKNEEKKETESKRKVQ